MICIYLFIKSPGFHTKHYPMLTCNFGIFFFHLPQLKHRCLTMTNMDCIPLYLCSCDEESNTKQSKANSKSHYKENKSVCPKVGQLTSSVQTHEM